MLVKLYNENPNDRIVRNIVSHLKKGGLIIYPTDTVYAIGCDMNNHKAIEKLAKEKNIKPEDANFSIICSDLSNLSKFARSVNNQNFKIIKHNTPGPFTFILEASKMVPKIFQTKKKTIGIRIPDNNICKAIIEELGNPLVSSSLIQYDDIIEYHTDPELIYEKYSEKIDLIIDGGYGDNTPSTIVDLVSDEYQIIRQGKGELLL